MSQDKWSNNANRPKNNVDMGSTKPADYVYEVLVDTEKLMSVLVTECMETIVELNKFAKLQERVHAVKITQLTDVLKTVIRQSANALSHHRGFMTALLGENPGIKSIKSNVPPMLNVIPDLPEPQTPYRISRRALNNSSANANGNASSTAGSQSASRMQELTDNTRAVNTPSSTTINNPSGRVVRRRTTSVNPTRATTSLTNTGSTSTTLAPPSQQAAPMANIIGGGTVRRRRQSTSNQSVTPMTSDFVPPSSFGSEPMDASDDFYFGDDVYAPVYDPDYEPDDDYLDTLPKAGGVSMGSASRNNARETPTTLSGRRGPSPSSSDSSQYQIIDVPEATANVHGSVPATPTSQGTTVSGSNYTQTVVKNDALPSTNVHNANHQLNKKTSAIRISVEPIKEENAEDGDRLSPLVSTSRPGLRSANGSIQGSDAGSVSSGTRSRRVRRTVA